MRRTSFRERKKKKRKRSSPIFKSSLATPRGIRGESEERVRSFVRVEDEERRDGRGRGGGGEGNFFSRVPKIRIREEMNWWRKRGRRREKRTREEIDRIPSVLRRERGRREEETGQTRF